MINNITHFLFGLNKVRSSTTTRVRVQNNPPIAIMSQEQYYFVRLHDMKYNLHSEYHFIDKFEESIYIMIFVMTRPRTRNMRAIVVSSAIAWIRHDSLL